MTADPDPTGFAGIDSYLVRHLREAAAELTSQVNTEATLDALLRTTRQDSTAGDAADVIRKD